MRLPLTHAYGVDAFIHSCYLPTLQCPCFKLFDMLLIDCNHFAGVCDDASKPHAKGPFNLSGPCDGYTPVVSKEGGSVVRGVVGFETVVPGVCSSEVLVTCMRKLSAGHRLLSVCLDGASIFLTVQV